MKKNWWFCLPFFLLSCVPEPDVSNWDGTYIGYFHRNQQDTTPVRLIFSGKYFAAAPHYASDSSATKGEFLQDESTLIFQNQNPQGSLLLQGVYQFRHSPDGSIRMWQDEGKEYREIILMHQ